MHLYRIPVDSDVARLELAEIHACHDLAVRHEQQLVTDKKVRKVGAFATTADDFVERKHDRLKTRELTDFLNHRRRRGVDARSPARKVSRNSIPKAALRNMRPTPQQEKSEDDSECQ